MIQPSPTFFLLLRNYNPITEVTTPQLKQAMQEYGNDVLDLFKEHYIAKNSNTPTKSLGLFFAKLDGKLKNIKDPGIIQGWRTYYESQPTSVKSEMLKNLPSPTFLGKSFPRGKAVSTGNIFSGPVAHNINLPGSQIPTNLIDTGANVASYITSNLTQASTIVGKLFNKNIVSIMSDISTSDTNHGGNLVPDSKHVERMGEIITDFTKKVLDTVGDANSFLLKAMNYNPFGVQNSDISSPPLNLVHKVEGQDTVMTPTGLDYIQKNKKQIKSYASPKNTNLV
jgi:hypothetical protein